jgi:PAS domain S-box-containing protein
LVGSVVLLILLLDLLLNGILEFLPSMSWLASTFFDGVLLVILLVPFLYLLVFRPMQKYIAQRKQAEDELMLAKDFAESLIRTANVIVIGLNQAGEITLMNETAEKCTGYSAAELTGKNWFKTMLPEYVYPKVWQEFISLTKIGNMPKAFENPILTKSGEERLISWQNGLLHIGDKINGTISFGVDITETRLAEESLKILNKKHQLILDSAGEGILGLDLNGNHTFVNPAATEMLGYSQEELIGKPSHSLWHHTKPDGTVYPEDECIIHHTLHKGLANYSSDDVFFRKDGSVFPVTYTSTPINDDAGVIGAVVTFTDITRIKQAELESQIQSEIVHSVTITADLQELLTLIHASIAKVIYADNCFFALYDQATGLFNFPYFVDKFETTPEPDAMPRSCTAYVFRTGESLIITQEIFNQLLVQNEVELVGPPSPSWIGIPLQTSSGIIGVLVLQHYEEENVYNENHRKFLDSIGSQVANVIERKRAEQELNAANSLLQATLESTADGILVVDKNGVISNYNRKFVELWQIPYSVIETKDDEKLLSCVRSQLKQPESFVNIVNELYQSGEKTSFDILEFNDGRIFERYSQPQRYDGKIAGRVWSFRDVTGYRKALDEIKKLAGDLEQRVIERTVQLQSANQELETFSYSASHEIRTPLRAVDGFANLLLLEHSQSLDEEGKRLLHIIISNANKMGHLIDDQLSYSALSRQELKFVKIDMYKMAKSMFQQLVDEADKNKYDFQLRNMPLAYGDFHMMKQVWANLLGNAIKYSAQKQKSIIEAGGFYEDGSVTYFINDNGVGFDLKHSNSLFRLFKRLPNARDYEGTGMGLAIVKRIITQHGGKVWAEGNTGEGAKFFFSLPNRNE